VKRCEKYLEICHLLFFYTIRFKILNPQISNFVKLHFLNFGILYSACCSWYMQVCIPGNLLRDTQLLMNCMFYLEAKTEHESTSKHIRKKCAVHMCVPVCGRGHSTFPVVWHVWGMGTANCMRNTLVETKYKVEI
jgi:hypothetical protein